jgi:hypothetical protein
MSETIALDLATITGLEREAIQLEHHDEINLTVLVDYGDAFEVLTYISDDIAESGWELCNNTGTLDTWSEAFANYVWHLDCHYGVTYEEAHPEQED